MKIYGVKSRNESIQEADAIFDKLVKKFRAQSDEVCIYSIW